MNKLNFIKNKKSGFTLIETMIGVAILALIIGVVTLFARDTFFYKDVFFSGLTSVNDSRHILQPLANEVRSASAGSLGAYPLEVVTDNTLIFYSDINNDGLKERIRYFVNGDVFSKGVISPSGNPLAYAIANEVVKPLIRDIANGGQAIFSYYDTSYNGETDPMTSPVAIESVRLIKINLIIDADPMRPPVPFSITTQINLRNLKDNL